MNASPSLQKAGRTFLLRLVAENDVDEAARILHDLADELEQLVEEEVGLSDQIEPRALRRREPNLTG